MMEGGGEEVAAYNRDQGRPLRKVTFELRPEW